MDSLYQHANTVIISHRPYQLGIRFYGDNKIQVNDTDLFWHILKNRSGTTPILRMQADFKHMKINEYGS